MAIAPKEALHRIIDALSDEQAAQLLNTVNDSDPVTVSLALAPVDDEPETDEERAGVAEARAQAARGELIDDADLVL